MSITTRLHSDPANSAGPVSRKLGISGAEPLASTGPQTRKENAI